MKLTFLPAAGIACWLLSACVHYGEKLTAELTQWHGQHPDKLVEQWGAPRSIYVMEKGNKVLTYETSETIARSFGYYRRPEIYTVSDDCKITFITDTSQKVIERSQFLGNPAVCWDLVARPQSPYSILERYGFSVLKGIHGLS